MMLEEYKHDVRACADAAAGYDFNENCQIIAESLGCSVVFPNENELQIDIDSEAAYCNFQRRYHELSGMVPMFRLRETPSKSGLPNRHITVKVLQDPPISEAQRILLQFILGSDPIRETLNAYRLFSGTPNPTRLFEPKDDRPKI